MLLVLHNLCAAELILRTEHREPFFLLAATPGDALTARVEKLPDAVAERLYAKYGLDRPIMERYVTTMSGLLHGDSAPNIGKLRPEI